MWPSPWTHVGTPSHLGHMERVAATMPSQAHAGAAQEAPDIGQWEGQDVPLVRPSSCNVKGGIPSSRRYLPTYLPLPSLPFPCHLSLARPLTAVLLLRVRFAAPPRARVVSYAPSNSSPPASCPPSCRPTCAALPGYPFRGIPLLSAPCRPPLHQFPDGGAGRPVWLNAGQRHGVPISAMWCTYLSLFAPCVPPSPRGFACIFPFLPLLSRSLPLARPLRVSPAHLFATAALPPRALSPCHVVSPLPSTSPRPNPSSHRGPSLAPF